MSSVRFGACVFFGFSPFVAWSFVISGIVVSFPYLQNRAIMDKLEKVVAADCCDDSSLRN